MRTKPQQSAIPHFVGMDPYLESSFWSNFHARLATEIADMVGAQLNDRYVTVVQKHFALVDRVEGVDSKGCNYPDIGIVAEPVATYGGKSQSASLIPPVFMRSTMPFEAPYNWVEVLDVEGMELVTSIEILSPWNKVGRGRVEYLAKRDRILGSRVHLLEIDLLRRGKRLPVDGDLPPASYYVFLSRYDQRPLHGIWPIQLGDTLPTVPVPLDYPDSDVLLDLQVAVSSVRKKSRCEPFLNYSDPLDLPFTEAEIASLMLERKAT